MSLNADQLYALLPAIYRIRDTENGQPLYALCTVLAAQAAVVEQNILQLYDDQFIETCAPWVVPYIGDLVGSDSIAEIDEGATGTRAEVANTIGYRRRKGTVLALEQVSHDVSGRPAKAVEFFKRLITTESMHHVRTHHDATANIRRFTEPEQLCSPFGTLNRTIDVRRIAPRTRSAPDPDPTPLDIDLHGGGRFNIPDIGVYLWRWQPFAITQAPAFTVDAKRYMFSPLGQDMPLFNNPPPRESFSSLTTRMDVPQPIQRREFARHLADFYGKNNSVTVYTDGQPVKIGEICCQDLSDRSGGGWGCTPRGRVAIDPVLGRIQFASDLPAYTSVQVSYCYGFPAQIGGGPYDRSSQLTGLDAAQAADQIGFTAVVGSSLYPTLESAVAQWNLQAAPGAGGLIVLPGFQTLDIDLTGTAAIALPAESQLWIVVAEPPAANASTYTYDNSLVLLRGTMEVIGRRGLGDGTDIPPAGQLFLSGLWLSGSVRVKGDAANVQIMDCTLVPGIALNRSGDAFHPGEPSLIAEAAAASLCLTRSITGPILNATEGSTRICSCIVDSGSPCAVAYAAPDRDSAGADLHIEDSTVVGKLRIRTLCLASNSIFVGKLARRDTWKSPLWCSRQQAGCVRFCFLPAGAIVPQQFRCLNGVTGQPNLFAPNFIVLRYGNPSYALLSGDAPVAIWTGADNGSQMGVYQFIQETEAVTNVQIRAPEYIPFGMEAGVFLEPSRPLPALRPKPPYRYGYGVEIERDPCGEDENDDLRFIGIGTMLL